jgi:GxxExxY protein
MLRVESPLSEEFETLIRHTIGCCIDVHRELGPGLLEGIYSRAVGLELRAAGIAFEREQVYSVLYRGERLYEQRLDFVVDDRLVLEIEAVDYLVPIHHSQILSYMRVAHLRAGLLMNFNVAILRDGIRRKVL